MANNHTEVERRLWDAADELRANSKLKWSEYSIPTTSSARPRKRSAPRPAAGGTRELLLPKLVSGQIDGSNLDIDTAPLEP